MARVTQVTGRNMIGILAAGISAVMAGNTVTDKGGMVHRGGNPLLRAVAGTAFSRSRNMSWMLAGGNYPVMTTAADSQYFVVVDAERRRPGYRTR